MNGHTIFFLTDTRTKPYIEAACCLKNGLFIFYDNQEKSFESLFLCIVCVRVHDSTMHCEMCIIGGEKLFSVFNGVI